MKKCNLFFLMLFACMLLASCGGSETEMTGKGMFGDIPQYLLQYLDLNKQCADELEFEDNPSKRDEIINKYQEKWADYVDDSKFLDKLLESSAREIPVEAPEDYRLSNAHLAAENIDLRINENKQYPVLKLQMRYVDKRPSDTYCFLMDEKDSVVFFGAFISDYHNNSEITLRVNGLNAKKAEERDVMKYSLYAIDKAVKIKVVPKEKFYSFLESYKRNADLLMKSLHEAGIVEISSFDEAVYGKDVTKTENKQEEEEEKNKPGAVDLACFGLRGPVMSFTEYRDNIHVYTNRFSEKGKWETMDGKKLSSVYSDIKRDSEKRICGFTDGEFDMVATHIIAYDAKTGWVSKSSYEDSGTVTTTYTYDDNGYVIKEVADGSYTDMGADEPTKVHDVTTFKYESFDKYGNWTKRSAKMSDGSTWVEKRNISYYK